MELINIIEDNDDIKMYEDILNYYKNIYHNEEYIKKINISDMNNTSFAKFSPITHDITINSNINKILSSKILEQGIRSKYNLSVDKLIKIMKLCYIIHEIRHSYQLKHYNENYKNIYKLNKENIYTKIIGDCIHYQTPEIYLAYYPYMVIEKDAELSSCMDIIKALTNINDEKLNKILSFYQDTFLNKIIRLGYINNDISRPSIMTMYQTYNALEEYLLLSDKLSNLDIIDKIRYNTRLSLPEQDMIEKEPKEEIIKQLIK